MLKPGRSPANPHELVTPRVTRTLSPDLRLKESISFPDVPSVVLHKPLHASINVYEDCVTENKQNRESEPQIK